MAITVITKENFNLALESDKVVLLDFYADWCGPCRMLSPVIEELATEVSGAMFCKINVDNDPELAKQFGIMSIPTLVVLKNGTPVNRAVGVRSKEQILAMLAL